MDWGYSHSSRVAQEEEDAIKSIDALLQAGAKWLPSTREIKSTRSSLLDHDEKYVVQVVRMLLYTPDATALEHVWELCRTDTMRLKIQAADRRLWDEIVDMAAKAGCTKATSRRSRDKAAGR